MHIDFKSDTATSPGGFDPNWLFVFVAIACSIALFFWR